MKFSVLRYFSLILFMTASVATWAMSPGFSEISPAFISSSTLDVLHQKLNIRVDPRVRYIDGSVTTTFRPTDSSLTAITLDLHLDLTIDSILGKDGSLLSFTRNTNHTFTIQLQDTIFNGSEGSVTIFYQGIPPESGFGSFTQSHHDTDAIIWTLSEPFGARDWWPCSQNLQDKIDSLDIYVTVPKGYKVASNGILFHEKPRPGDKVEFHWRHRYPIATYLVAFAVTNYKIHQFEIPLTHGDLPILNYLYPQDYERHSTTIESILPPLMALYDTLFIPYPFHKEKYGHAQFGFGGGMEHQTISFMGGFNFELIAHELAHQWFGDYVTCGSWQDVWLNEGFASYLTGLAYENLYGPDEWQIYLTSAIRNVTQSPGGMMKVVDTSNYQRIFNSRLSYHKGAMVLHMLRWIVGDDHFFQGVRNYLLDESTRYSFAKTDQFRTHLEAVSGKDLSGFFEDWYQGEGFPTYHLVWQQKDTGIMVKVFQTTSHSSVPFFELPLEIGLYSEGDETLVRLDVTHDQQSFDIRTEESVDSIIIDPRHWIISKNNTTRVATQNHPSPEKLSFNLYPNPASSFLHIHNQSTEKYTELKVWQLSGKVFYRRIFTFNPDDTWSIDVLQWPSGLYLLQMTGNSGISAVRKIAITR